MRKSGRVPGLALAVLALAGPLRAASPAGPSDEPPLVGMPENFNGAVGTFRVTTEARPTELQAEDPLLFTVRVTATGSVRTPPNRPDLRKLPRFTSRFQIEDLPRRDRAVTGLDGPSWEFFYHLRPLNTEVKAVPALLFGYYKPGTTPAVKGYRTTAAGSIPLTVKPRTPPPLVAAPPEPTPPAWLTRVPTGPAVLRRDEPPGLPGPLALAALALTPPALALAWYAWWRRRHPDAGRHARLQRSRAARLALKRLHAGPTADRPDSARHAAHVLAEYLSHRLDVPPVSGPGPDEVAGRLAHAGCPRQLAEKVVEFFRASDTARYAPAPGPHDLPAAAEHLIHQLESESWPSPAC